MGYSPVVKAGPYVFVFGQVASDVVKADIYLTDCQDFYRVEGVWKKYFPNDPPARTTVPVTDLGVPGLRVAINLVAYVPEGGPAKRTIHTNAAPTPLAHEPQAVQAGPFLFLSNQLATDYQTGIVPEARVDPNFPFHASAAEQQLTYIAKNVEAICQAAGTSRANDLAEDKTGAEVIQVRFLRAMGFSCRIRGAS